MKIFTTDFLIIGSGIAGLQAALTASQFGNVIIITKGELWESNTKYAQGGIAAAIDKKDSPRFHLEDTLAAGAGLCSKKNVSILVREGVKRVKELIEMGANFDRKINGFSLTKEGAHRTRRILHAQDATGAEIARTLAHKVLGIPSIKVFENIFAVKLITKNKNCFGAITFDKIKNSQIIFSSKATILASGGAGQIYEYTTNPELATGDGISMAFEAGCTVSDLEFIQFHPTTLEIPHMRKTVSVFLISESVRGEGAILKNVKGERFMPKYHPLAELAPRDIVARAIINEIKKTKHNCVYLDLSSLKINHAEKRFPTIYQRCLELGIDITRQQIPVAPAAHYSMGGVITDPDGKTNIKGLFASGEVANVGVHGANRLASNSLLDGLVFGQRAALAAGKYIRKVARRSPACHALLGMAGRSLVVRPKQKMTEYGIRNTRYELNLLNKIKTKIRKIMWGKVGIIRNGEELQKAVENLFSLKKLIKTLPFSWQKKEVENMILVSSLTAKAAFLREESRGAHFREDYPKINDRKWKKHLVFRK